MKAGTVPLVIFFVLCAMIAVISLGRGDADNVDTSTVAGDIPVPAKTPPHPKAEFETTEHNFGMMHQGQKGEYTFIVSNQGEVPLRMVARQEDTTCQCTVGKVGKKGIAPGESSEVTLNWEIKSAVTKFHHTAKLRTNDPEQPTIVLHIKGTVGNLLKIRPHTEWPAGTLVEGKEVALTGSIHSEILDEFKITEIKTSSEHVTAEYKKVPEDDLSKLIDKPEEFPLPPGSKRQKREVVPATSGYDLTITVSPRVAVGSFRHTIQIFTDVEEAKELTMYVYGNRNGPMEFYAKGSVRWHQKFMVAQLGRFKASEGFKGGLMLYIKKFNGKTVEIAPDSITSEPSFIKCNVVRDEEFNSPDRERFDIEFEIPPGSPAITFNKEEFAIVKMKTTHPDAPQIRFKLDFSSY